MMKKEKNTHLSLNYFCCCMLCRFQYMESYISLKNISGVVQYWENTFY